MQAVWISERPFTCITCKKEVSDHVTVFGHDVGGATVAHCLPCHKIFTRKLLEILIGFYTGSPAHDDGILKVLDALCALPPYEIKSEAAQ